MRKGVIPEPEMSRIFTFGKVEGKNVWIGLSFVFWKGREKEYVQGAPFGRSDNI